MRSHTHPCIEIKIKEKENKSQAEDPFRDPRPGWPLEWLFLIEQLAKLLLDALVLQALVKSLNQ